MVAVAAGHNNFMRRIQLLERPKAFFAVYAGHAQVQNNAINFAARVGGISLLRAEEAAAAFATRFWFFRMGSRLRAGGESVLKNQ